MRRIAAARTSREQIVDATHDDGILAEADQFLYGFDAGRQFGLDSLFRVQLFKFLGPEKFGQNVSRQGLAVTDGSEQVVRSAEPVLVGYAFHLVLVAQESAWPWLLALTTLLSMAAAVDYAREFLKVKPKTE